MNPQNNEAFKADLLNAAWPNCNILHIDEAIKSFTQTFTDIVDKHFPLTNKRIKRHKQPGWMSAEITRCMKLRDNSKKQGKHEDYRFYRNLTVSMIREAKTNYYRKHVEDNRNNPSKLSRLFDELSGKSTEQNIERLTYNDITLEDDNDIANAFNQHFVGIAEKYTKGLTDKGKSAPDLSYLKEHVKSKLPCETRFNIPRITELHVAKFLKNLDVSKATGLCLNVFI